MDGKKQNIEEHFKGIYEDLYNSVDDRENITNILNNINKEINSSHVYDIEKVTPSVVKEASRRLENGKSDPVHMFSSDCLKNAPDSFFDKLSIIIRSFLVHGHMTTYLLLATLVPIVKNKLVSINTSKNFRSIAISSLILKIKDWMIISLFGRKLGFSQKWFRDFLLSD